MLRASPPVAPRPVLRTGHPGRVRCADRGHSHPDFKPLPVFMTDSTPAFRTVLHKQTASATVRTADPTWLSFVAFVHFCSDRRKPNDVYPTRTLITRGTENGGISAAGTGRRSLRTRLGHPRRTLSGRRPVAPRPVLRTGHTRHSRRVRCADRGSSRPDSKPHPIDMIDTTPEFKTVLHKQTSSATVRTADPTWLGQGSGTTSPARPAKAHHAPRRTGRDPHLARRRSA